MIDYLVIDKAGNGIVVKDVLGTYSENGLLCFLCADGIEYFNIETTKHATTMEKDGRDDKTSKN